MDEGSCPDGCGWVPSRCHCSEDVKERRAEIALVKAVLSHPAGFYVSVFAMLDIRTTDQDTIEVEWELSMDERRGLSDPATTKTAHRSFPRSAMDEAVAFFVGKRRERQLGVDYEAKAQG